MRLIELFKTATFRLAVLFALTVTLSTSVVFLFIYWQVAAFDAKRLDIRLAQEMEHAVLQPEDQLRRALDLRVTNDLRVIDYAAEFNADGKFLYGNVTSLPENLPIDGAPHTIDSSLVLALDGRTDPSIFVAGRRPDGNIVLLGRSLYEVFALRQLVVKALMIGIVPATILALIAGFIFSLRGTRRLVAINQQILRIMRGNLYERLPIRGKKDDIDYVAGAVNLMLDEIVRLLDQIKSVGDNIAHDLRTPLAIARMRLESDLRKHDNNYLRLTAQQTILDLDRALTTVTALLRISEIESGRRRSNFQTVDLAEVCADVFDLYEPLAEAKSISMKFIKKDKVPIVGDFDLLIEAIANLVDNAIKFTPGGKEVFIAAEMIDEQPMVRIGDRGIGVAPDDRQNIFKRFYRSAKNNALPGNGLGLSMAATIIELHGLYIRVEDNMPGALFIITTQKEAGSAATDTEFKTFRTQRQLLQI
jgi:signal transduction histidine kinase